MQSVRTRAAGVWMWLPLVAACSAPAAGTGAATADAQIGDDLALTDITPDSATADVSGAVDVATADVGGDAVDADSTADAGADAPADVPQDQEADASPDAGPDVENPGPPPGNPVQPPEPATWTVSGDCVVPEPVPTPLCMTVKCAAGQVCMGAGICVPDGPFDLPTTLPSQVAPALASRPDGAWAVAWYDGTIDTEMHVYINVSVGGGAQVSPDLQVDEPGPQTAYAPSLVSLANGTWLVVWREELWFQGQVRFWGRRVATDGSHVLGPQFEITQGWQYVGGGSTNVVSPLAVRLRNDAFLVAWPSAAVLGEPMTVHARRLDQLGAVVGPELEVGAGVGVEAYSPAIAPLPLGESLLTWQASTSKGPVRVFGRHFGNDGSPLGAVMQLSPGQQPYEALPDVTAFEDGAVLLVWKIAQEFSSTVGVDIVARRLPADFAIANGGSLHGAGADPDGTYPDQPPTVTLSSGRAAILWHQASIPGSDVYLRRYYRQPDLLDCETTAIAGPLDGTEGGTRHLPAAEALPDGRLLVAWNTYVTGGVKLRMRFLPW